MKLDRKPAPGRFLPEVGIQLTEQDGRRISATGSQVLGPDCNDVLVPPKNGIWLTNRDFVELSAIGMDHRGGHVKPDGWMGPQWDQILTEWGLRMPLQDQAAQALAEMAGRVVRLGISAASGMGSQSREQSCQAELGVGRHPSFSSALRPMIQRRLDKTRPGQVALHEVSRDLHLFGTAVAPPPISGRRSAVTFIRSRYCWANMLAALKTPLPGLWQRIELPETPVTLCDRLLGELDDFERPVIVAGGFRPFTLVLPPWVRSWLAGYAGSYGRRSFILEEIRLLRTHGEFCVREAFAGPGWRPAADALQRQFLQGLARVCGSAQVAMLSWSAGLAAENLLLAAATRPGEFRVSFPLESSWLAAHDRIAAVPAMEAVDSCGAVLISARAGTLCVGIRESREAVLKLVRALWELGWWPAGGLRGSLAQIAGNPDQFGGSAEERAIAVAMRDGPEGIAGQLDRLPDLPVAIRRKRTRALRLQLDQLVA